MSPTARSSAEATDESDFPDLPHEARVDEKLVREAVTHIRESLAETLFKGATVVGDYVLKHFFDNRPERVRSKNPTKNASFRALAEKCGTDLPISKSWLNNAVGVAVMRQLLPDGATAFKQLPPTHQTMLLPLRDPVKVEKLAHKAMTKQFSARNIRDIVREEVAKSAKDEGGEKRGRPPTPVILKTLNRSLKLFTLEGGKRSFTKAMVEELTESQAKKAQQAAEGLIGKLEALVEKLKGKG